MNTKNKYFILLFPALGGFAVWLLITSAFNLREAWDGRGFWPFSVAMLALNAAMGFLEPGRVIRNGLLSVSLQPVAVFIRSGEIGSLFPIGLVMFFVLGLLFSIGGATGAFVKKVFFTPPGKAGESHS